MVSRMVRGGQIRIAGVVRWGGGWEGQGAHFGIRKVDMFSRSVKIWCRCHTQSSTSPTHHQHIVSISQTIAVHKRSCVTGSMRRRWSGRSVCEWLLKELTPYLGAGL